MRNSQPIVRRVRLNQSDKLGYIVIYVCAIALGVGVAYAFLSTGPFRGARHAQDGAEVLDPVLSSRQHAALDSSSRAGSAGGGRKQQQAVPAAAAKQQQQEQQLDSDTSKVVTPEGAEEQAWFKKLDVEGCRATEHLRVCSHRAKSLEITDVFPGSLAAYAALWKANVRCFDIDFVATSDGQLIASHPDDLQQGLSDAARFGVLRKTIGQHALADIRSAGADEDRFPTMQAVLTVLAKELEEEEDKWWLKEGTPLDYSRLPAIFMDLKGDAFSPESIKSIAATARELHITQHVCLFVLSAEHEAVAVAAGYDGPLIRGYMDREDPNPTLTAEGVARYAMLGPSVHMSDAFFKRAQELEKPVHVWTVDTPSDLHKALEMKVDSAISNRPLALRSVLFDWRDRCSDHL